MNAKSLLTGIVNEADGLPPRGMPSRRMRPMPNLGLGGGPGAEPAGPPAQFTDEEYNQLKDVMLYILARVAGSPMDADIAKRIIDHQELTPTDLAHISDEGDQSRLPPSYQALSDKLYKLAHP